MSHFGRNKAEQRTWDGDVLIVGGKRFYVVRSCFCSWCCALAALLVHLPSMLNTKRKYDKWSLEVELGPAPVTTLSIVLVAIAFR